MTEVSYRQLNDATKEELELLAEQVDEYRRTQLADNLLATLERLKEDDGVLLVTEYEHSLQCATRAHRDGKDEEYVVAALLHDILNPIALNTHSEAAAAILRPYVREEIYWIIKHHGVFQMYHYADRIGGDKNARDIYKDSPYFVACAEFCAKYDQNAFDPDYDTLPIGFFEPMVRRVFANRPDGPAFGVRPEDLPD